MIVIGADGKSQKTRQWIRDYLDTLKKPYVDLGAQSVNDHSDISSFVPRFVVQLQETSAEAILTCGTGIGVCIGMNRFKGVRAVLAPNPQYAAWARINDGCNVLCVADWAIDNPLELSAILDAWFAARFENIPRRVKRIAELDNLSLSSGIPNEPRKLK